MAACSLCSSGVLERLRWNSGPSSAADSSGGVSINKVVAVRTLNRPAVILHVFAAGILRFVK